MRASSRLVVAFVTLLIGGLAPAAASGPSAPTAAGSILTTTATPTSDLDPGFGVAGSVHVELSPETGGGTPKVIEDAQGRILVFDRILVVNYAGTVIDGKIVVYRFTPTGTLDTSFGDQGIATIDYGTAYEFVNDVALDDSGRIVVAAQGFDGRLPAGYRWLIMRLDPNGVLDPTFGSGGFVDFTPFEDHRSPYDSIRTVRVDTQGRIVFGGFACSPGSYPCFANHVVFGRLTSSGEFDTDFGSGGLVITTGDIGIFASLAFTVDSTGRIVAAVLPDASETLSLIRVDGTGAGDESFGVSGIAEIPALGRSVDGLTVDSQDRLLIVQESSRSLSAQRVTSTGALDETYGVNGVFTFEAEGSGGMIVYGVVLDSLDRAVIYGDWYSYVDWDQFVVRVRPDGVLDTSFSGDGFTAMDGFPGDARGSDSTTGATVDSSNRIVTAGSSWNGLHDADEVTHLTITRFLAQSDGPIAGELCNGWLPMIAGTEGDDMLTGTPGDDVISGGAGNDVIRGLGGNDVLCGGDGDDEVYGGGGWDLLEGNAGNDLLRGGPGDDASFGGPGEDRIQSGPGADILWGGDGKDKLWGGIGDDEMLGQGGNDQLHGNRDNDYLNGGDGTDRLWGDAGDDRLYGVANSDFLYGGIGNDLLKGGDGNDRLFGWTGDDDLYGESGRDQLRGQDGADYVNGGPHHDWCSVETEWIDCESPL